MKKNVLLLTVLFATGLLFTACSTKADEKDEPTPPTTVAEDKTNIQAAFDQLDTNFNQFKTGVSFTEVDSFISYVDADILAQDWLDSMGTKLDAIADFEQIDIDGRFNFTSFKGKYVWSNASETWTKSTNPSIIVQFPSARTLVVNNCEFGVIEYTDSPFMIDAQQVYLPTKVNAYLNKDGAKLAGVNLAASYNPQGFPINASIAFYAKPLTISGLLEKQTDSRYKITGSLVNEANTGNSLSVSTTITFENNITAYSEFNDAVVNNVSVSLTQGLLNVTGTIDIKTLNQLDDAPGEPSATDLNNTMNILVNYNGEKIGTLKVVEIGGVKEMYIVYKDGTQENTSMHYSTFVNNVETLFK